jgi:hypothetical protein
MRRTRHLTHPGSSRILQTFRQLVGCPSLSEPLFDLLPAHVPHVLRMLLTSQALPLALPHPIRPENIRTSYSCKPSGNELPRRAPSSRCRRRAVKRRPGTIVKDPQASRCNYLATGRSAPYRLNGPGSFEDPWPAQSSGSAPAPPLLIQAVLFHSLFCAPVTY